MQSSQRQQGETPSGNPQAWALGSQTCRGRQLPEARKSWLCRFHLGCSWALQAPSQRANTCHFAGNRVAAPKSLLHFKQNGKQLFLDAFWISELARILTCTLRPGQLGPGTPR